MFELVNYEGLVKSTGLTKEQAETKAKETGYTVVALKKAITEETVKPKAKVKKEDK